MSSQLVTKCESITSHVEISTDREFLVAELLPVKALRNFIAVAQEFFAPEDSKEIFGR
jgi:hypothetical protein